MWAVAEGLGDAGVAWIKGRIAASNNTVPSMCEVGTFVTTYASDNVDTLVQCATQYNPATATKIALDAVSLAGIVAMNGFSLPNIGNAMICGVLDCLQAAYKNQFCPKYKGWLKKVDKTAMQNQVCAMGVQYLQNSNLVQTCFNACKARTQVAVMQKLFDPFVPKYAGMYQTYRDKSTVACMTKSQICGCNQELTDLINAAGG
ncbi:unnamed protein product, partial [Mesorhabditis spiculigera]